MAATTLDSKRSFWRRPNASSGYVILTNGDNGTEVIGKLASGDTPLTLFVTG